ncbi:restriction endonuclease S subunit [Sphaerotilus sulfidivorans]|uniref:Restriction endonuclease S subunit n=1 Tax=Sphaerotilus sulfidivorans TaxID=639200 RepID=A0A5C1Q5Z5_9BURK|nr:restriction endonuclease subunit S [Sphaerotilus sulfidivorans]NZD47274.1 restriction endonuclease subunit S [Sphaerotilus sulfidivorans]QEN02808.1 restriction endonuclease subunit S [Sphaerotilus sulfidivorans]
MQPSDWEVRAVEELGLVQAGRQRSPDFVDGSLRPYLRVANVFDGRIDTSDVNKMRFTDKEFERYQLKSGDILLNEGQSFELVGRPALYEGEPRECCFQNTLIRFRPSSRVDPSFALKLFQQCLYDGTFQSIAKKTTSIAHLGVSRFASLRLLWPPLDEQKRISRTLDVWNESIRCTEALFGNRQAQLKALLAIVLHLPPAIPGLKSEADNGGYPASVQPGIPNLPRAPEGWRRITLGEHLTEVRRPASLRADDEYRLVTVKRSRGGVELRETLTGREIKTPSQFYVRTGDFLISKRQIVHGACGIVPAELDGAVVSNEYAVLNSDGQIDLRFLRYLSESRYFQQTCFHSSIGVHVEKMIFKTERWLKWPFNIPPLPVQQRIVEVLDTARREVELIAAQIERLKQEKAALMADLLTGKRRVKLNAEAVSTP